MARDNGLASFQKRLREMPEQVRQSLGPDLERAAGDVAQAIRALAPVESGDLVQSITVTGPGQETPPYSQPGGAFVVPATAAAVTVGNSEVRYPHLVEYGTTRTAPKPFFWPGFRLSRAAAVAVITGGIRRVVRGRK